MISFLVFLILFSEKTFPSSDGKSFELIQTLNEFNKINEPRPQNSYCLEEENKHKEDTQILLCQLDHFDEVSKIDENGDIVREILIPKNHPVLPEGLGIIRFKNPFSNKEKRKFNLSSVGLSVGVLNDDHANNFIPSLNSDDVGNTFGLGGGMTLTFSEDKSGSKKPFELVLDLDHDLSLFTAEMGQTLYERNRDSYQKRISNFEDGTSAVSYSFNYLSPNEDDKKYVGNPFKSNPNLAGVYRYNQAAVTVKRTSANLRLSQKDSPLVGVLGVGVTQLDDTKNQAGTKIQNNWHELNNIYVYNWWDYSNLIIDGIENYLNISSQIGIKAEAKKGQCEFKGEITSGVRVNVPLQDRDNELRKINFLIDSKNEAKLKISDDKKKSHEFNLIGSINASLDPQNPFPRLSEAGSVGYVQPGLSLEYVILNKDQRHLKTQKGSIKMTFFEFAVPIYVKGAGTNLLNRAPKLNTDGKKSALWNNRDRQSTWIKLTFKMNLSQ